MEEKKSILSMSENTKLLRSAKKIKPKVKTGKWSRLKGKWKQRGVVEIDSSHHRFELLNTIRQGIQCVVNQHPELGPKNMLTPDDYTHVLSKAIQTESGQTFEFVSYASSVFASLRQAVGVTESDYVTSLAPDSLPYLQFLSNSKGGQDFFLTNDKTHFLKTEKEYYVNVFLDMLGEYLEHFLQHPHSLLVKFLGLYSVKMPGQDRLYFYVMTSIFYPDSRIEQRFDIKGATAGRFQEPEPPGSKALTILKDENFLTETIELGSQRDWFIRQINIDANFLRELGVQDYSLLVGRHPLQETEKQQNLGDLITRVRKSFHPTGSEDHADEHLDMAARKAAVVKDELEDTEKRTEDNTSETKSMPYTPRSRSSQRSARRNTPVPDFGLGNEPLEEIIEKENRRLLPISRNALHIIDGPEYRYYLGIIDFLTLYECRQRTGRILKSIKHRCGDQSTVPPDAYATRFVNFITEHTG